MRQPSDLTREQLEDIVGQVRDILWQDPATGALDPDRSWDTETIEWVSGVLEDAGLKPDPVPPAAPVADEPREGPPAVAMRSALEAFIRTIEATGGCIRPGRATVNLGGQEIVESEGLLPVPAGDEEWADLADAYLLACRALGREPMLRDEDDDQIPRSTDRPVPRSGRTCRGCRRLTGSLHDLDRRYHMELPYFLTGSVRVRECPEIAAILVRILAYRDVDFDVTLTELGGGEVELSIDGARELDDDRMTRLEEQLQALGPYAREAAVFRRSYELDSCDVIVAPSREAGRVALSRVVLEDIRLSLGALVPEDRARLAEELRAATVP